MLERGYIMSYNETIRLYDDDAYAVEFEAKVLSCEETTFENSAAFSLILDQTLFFPEEGGQSPDKGFINDIEVLDIQISNNIITHTIKQQIPADTTVRGKIDWTHRFNNMQQHSGEHIFSGLVHKYFGFDNVGFHLSDQIVTMDFNGTISVDEIYRIEEEVNKVISSNIPVLVSYPSKEELSTMEYRSKIEIEGQVRLITIPGYDVCACCAPHVKNTGEIGLLKVMSFQNYKGGIRISILCGFRALFAFRKKSAIVSDLVDLFTTSEENILDNVKKLKSANQDLTYKLGEANTKLLEQKIALIPDSKQDVILFEEGINSKVLRNVINNLMENKDGICGIFCGNDNDGYSFIIGSKSIDCREIATLLREKLGSKGGGNNQMIQGSINASEADINDALSSYL